MILLITFAIFFAECSGTSVKIFLEFHDQRIVGGQIVDINQHPHQLSLQKFSHMCGASILSEEWAITAGHCVGADPSYYRLSAGSSSISNGTQHQVSEIVRHPRFDPAHIDFDIAVMKLAGKFVFGNSIRPVELPERKLSTGTIVNVTGWGSTGEGLNDGLLRRISVPIVSQEECESAYKGINQITERMICAGLFEEGGKDSCQGDSGGPLTVDGTLYGIVSWGFGCAKPHFPGVYTNVAELRSWIGNITGI